MKLDAAGPHLHQRHLARVAPEHRRFWMQRFQIAADGNRLGNDCAIVQHQGRHALHRVAGLRIFAGIKHGGRQNVHRRKSTFEHADIDVLAFAGPISPGKSAGDGERRIDGGQKVRDKRPWNYRRAVGHPVEIENARLSHEI